MSYIKYRHISLILFLVQISGFAAAESDTYLGSAIGQSSINVEGYDQGFFYKLYGGMRKKYYGFEASYNRLARFDISGNNTGSVSVSGIEASGITFLPILNNIELFIKVGFFSWSATGRINGGFIPKNKGNDLTYSAGAQYNVAQKVKLRAEYQRFKGVLGDDITSVSTGVSFRF